MKSILAFATIAALALTAAVPVEAAKEKKGKGNRGGARMLSRFDANNDGSLDSTEAERVRMAFNAFKALDKDNDGKLSDEEITSARVAKKRGKGAAAKSGSSSSSTSPSASGAAPK